MQQDLARLVEDADVHGAGVEIDAGVVLVLLGVEPHGGRTGKSSLVAVECYGHLSTGS